MSKLYIDKNASLQVRQFIQAAQQVLFSTQTAPVIKQMFTGSQSLVKGAAPFVANLVLKLEASLGSLEMKDEAMVILHICGYIVDMAKELNDPEVKKGEERVVAQMALAVRDMIHGQQGQSQQQMPQPPQGAPLGQLGGMQ